MSMYFPLSVEVVCVCVCVYLFIFHRSCIDERLQACPCTIYTLVGGSSNLDITSLICYELFASRYTGFPATSNAAICICHPRRGHSSGYRLFGIQTQHTFQPCPDKHSITHTYLTYFRFHLCISPGAVLNMFVQKLRSEGGTRKRPSAS